MFDFQKKQPRQLKEIETTEVSVVDKAANKKKFLFYKKEGEPMNHVELLFDMLEKNNLLEEDEVEIAKSALEVLNGLDDNAIDAVADLLQVVTQNDAIQKSVKTLWPSFLGIPTVKAEQQEELHSTEVCKWPSFNH